ncbi:hypothetical protein ACFWGI_06210 [Streptomyces niveus]|uniref:hypothetical protein n=1 Tax=Streptomyces niveus TaxID=193462 RepID=UPI003656D31D
MLTPPPDMYPNCPWADQLITGPHIGTAATVEAGTGLTTRYKVHAYDPDTRTVVVTPDVKEDRAGVVRPFSADQRAQHQPVALGDLDELRLIHERERDDTTALHTGLCRHAVKTAFTAGGDRGVVPHRRVYRMWMQTSEERAYRFLVRAPSQTAAEDLARTWLQGTPGPEGWIGSRLETGETIAHLICEGARGMQVWPYPDPIADIV